MQRNEHTSSVAHSDESGSTLVVVALLMAAVAMLSLSFLTMLRSSQKENQGSRESLSALYACEAGLTAAVDDLTRGGSGVLGTKNNPIGLGGQFYWVEAADIGNGRTQLSSYGRDERTQMGVELVVQRTPGGFFHWAAFGDESLQLDASARTDSYDSSVGSYLSQKVNGSGPDAYANSAGDIASNADIVMGSSVGVWGNANPGPCGAVSGNLANISGNTTPLAAAVQLTDIVVPALPSSGSLDVDSSDVLQSGDYHYSSLRVKDGKTLTIIGPATIVCDDFKLKNGARIEVNATDGPVQFYVLGDFVLNSDTKVYATSYSPLDVSFNLLSDNIQDPGIDVDFDEDELDFDAGAKMYATVYAPSAAVAIDSNFELFGALVARRVDVGANCSLHYDEHLATVGNAAQTAYQRLCWRVVANP